MSIKKYLFVQVAAWGYEFSHKHGVEQIGGCPVQPIKPVFPAVTCTAQATFRTATLPAVHGMVGNGSWFDQLQKPLFWEQSSRLVEGRRIWDGYRTAGGKVGLAFIQQSLGEDADLVISPAPIHKHGGGMIMGCYSKPAGVVERMTAVVGRRFRLMDYWGPLSGPRGSEWIADAICALLDSPDAPDLLYTYLPALDYDLQRVGPDHPKSATALRAVQAEIGKLLRVATGKGYEVVCFGDYAIESVTHPPVLPNRALRKAGLFRTRDVAGRAYPDFYQSQAFVVCDHQVGTVYCPDSALVPQVATFLRELPGVEEVMDTTRQRETGVAHPNAGALVVVAEPGSWLAYPWWDSPKEAPDFATHVDIHNKPGFDPCELFFGGWNPFQVSIDTSKVRGSHGRADGDARAAAFLSTTSFDHTSLLELAESVAEKLKRQ